MPRRPISAPRRLALAAALGATGCAGIGAGDTALCRELAGPAARLSDALAAHPETPDAVGEPATDALVIAQGGCP